MPRLCIRVALYIQCGGVRVAGRGLIEALEAIEKEGSIRAAARRLGMNHRRLLERIHRAERLLGFKLVETSATGSRLTREARELVKAFREASSRLPDCIETGMQCG